METMTKLYDSVQLLLCRLINRWRDWAPDALSRHRVSRRRALLIAYLRFVQPCHCMLPTSGILTTPAKYGPSSHISLQITTTHSAELCTRNSLHRLTAAPLHLIVILSLDAYTKKAAQEGKTNGIRPSSTSSVMLALSLVLSVVAASPGASAIRVLHRTHALAHRSAILAPSFPSSSSKGLNTQSIGAGNSTTGLSNTKDNWVRQSRSGTPSV